MARVAHSESRPQIGGKIAKNALHKLSAKGGF